MNIAVWLCAASILFSGAVRARPVPVRNVRDLIERADLICKGRVAGPAAPDSVVIHVDGVFKGEIAAGTVQIRIAGEPEAPSLRLQQGDYRLLFLRSDSNDYSLVDRFHGAMLVTSRVVSRLDGVDTTRSIERELIASLDDPDREIAMTAIEQLVNIGGATAVDALQTLARSADREMQAKAYAALIRLGDYSVLGEAAALVEQPETNEIATRVQAGIAAAIANIGDRGAVPALIRMFESPSVSLRQSATRALRNLRDPASMRTLIQALDDADADVRYNALMAIASVEEAPAKAPARARFNGDEAFYIGHWKQWWTREGRIKYNARVR